MMQRILGWTLGAAGCLLLALMAWPVINGQAQSSGGFSGRATVVKATLLGLQPIVLSDTGDLDSAGGEKEASLLNADESIKDPLTGRELSVSAQVGHASTIGHGDHSRSEASVANLNLTAVGHTIAAGFLMSKATAVCNGGLASVSGDSEIVDLFIDGSAIAVVAGQPNQTISIPPVGTPVGRVVINEQTSQGPGDITVNALHVVVYDPLGGPNIADVVISSAHADITCPTPLPPCPGTDFVTGGGWITGTPSGARGNFAVAGGTKKGVLWGHLSYIDHGSSGPKVKGTGVTNYAVTGLTSRHIDGTCEVNGQGGFTYHVDVADNGEPGRNDTFSLNLSNGYSASGTLAGGNIQLHTPCQ